MLYKPGILLGQITKTSGFEGAVIVRLEKKFIDNIPEMESVFLEIDGKPVPFFISELELTGPDIKIKFDDYGSLEKVSEFKGCRIFLASGDITYEEDPDLTLIKGFLVLNQRGKKLGRIKEIIQGPGQLLLSLENPGLKEILIPLHEDLIIDIDNTKKTVRMEIPQGLTDINM